MCLSNKLRRKFEILDIFASWSQKMKLVNFVFIYWRFLIDQCNLLDFDKWV